MSEPLDMPDGPGWWACKSAIGQPFAVCMPVFEVQGLLVNYQWGRDEHYVFTLPIDRFKACWPGEWYRLTMPWEEQQPAPSVPDDVREAWEAIRETLNSAIRDDYADELDVMDRWAYEQGGD